jgi:transcriptional regulator with XRE-family HTH domain
LPKRREAGPTDPIPGQGPESSASDDAIAPAQNALAADGDVAVNQLRRSIGAKLRELREGRNMSLRALASQCGVTSGFLSQIENARVMPSVATLVRVCSILGADVGDVFAASQPTGRLVRRSDRVVYSWPDGGMRDEVVSADVSRRIEVLHSTFEPGAGTGDEPFAHGAEVEIALVIRGTIVVQVGDESFELHEGDALTFDGGTPHAVNNPGTEPAETVWVATPARF